MKIIVTDSTEDKPGVDGTPFTITLDKKWFPVDDVTVVSTPRQPKRAYLEWMREIEDLLNIRYNNG